MNLTAEIKTGKRRVIEYLLSPVEAAVKDFFTAAIRSSLGV